MLIHKQDDRLDIFISNGECISFGKIVSFVHKSVNIPLSLFITFNSNYLQGLDLVENFEVLLDHTPVTCLTLIIDQANPKYEQIERSSRFIKDVYGYNVHVVGGIAIEIT